MKKTDFFLIIFLVFLMVSGIACGISSCMGGKIPVFSDGSVRFTGSAPSRLLLDKRETLEIPIIMYHGITENGRSESEYFISQSRFESDLKWYKDNDFTTVLPSQLIAYAESGAKLPEKPILLTFDDGYCNNYLYAYPLLEKYGMKAVISLIGADSEISSDDIYRVPSSCNLSWGEVAVMAKSGLVEFGNHTYNLHQIAGGRKGADQKKGESLSDYHTILFKDLTQNQEKIEQVAGKAPLMFAWPYGAYPQDKNADEVLKSLGLKLSVNSYQRMAHITQGDPESLYGLGRYLRTPDFRLEKILEDSAVL